ncbi:FecR domain-containing protein [Fulvivirgaceae bacterium PWU5]|uniref:FecR domain-containing protein n=1 Tax=Dawidia cretensis TaxID=2782350 RepID=A0AAP2E443_9BACT|nr:FecR domain-containing protein [Dawidia cretensis]MBT1711783.1 FecR domain-containing protein [Dawidia cretensis]
MSIDEQHFKRLLDAYLKGSATSEEKTLLDDFFETYPELHRPSASADPAVREVIWRQLATNLPARAPQGKGRTLLTIGYSVAAALALFAVSWFLVARYSRDSPAPAVAQLRQAVTDRGQKLKIELLDGTQVTLNANSKLEFPEQFEGNVREVYLTGEAYFQVARDTARPFIVHTPVANTRVLGTAFNVRLTPDSSAEVTLVEGKVDVDGVILKPNQQAIARSHGEPVHVRDVDVAAFVDWKDNILRFDNMPLGEAVTMLEDWYGVEITLGDALATCTISATYRKETLKNVLTSISYMLKVTYQQEGNKIVLQGSGCK